MNYIKVRLKKHDGIVNPTANIENSITNAGLGDGFITPYETMKIDNKTSNENTLINIFAVALLIAIIVFKEYKEKNNIFRSSCVYESIDYVISCFQISTCCISDSIF